MHLSRRMQAVQRPIIPVVGELIRPHPGTISLGQGVVHYGPPPQAAERSRAFWPTRRTTSIKPVEGIRRAGRGAGAKLAAENGIVVGPQQPGRGHGRRQHGVFQRPAGHCRSGRRDHPARPLLLQPRDGRGDAQLPGRCSCRWTRTTRSTCWRVRRARHAAHAGDRHHLAEQPQRARSTPRRR